MGSFPGTREETKILIDIKPIHTRSQQRESQGVRMAEPNVVNRREDKHNVPTAHAHAPQVHLPRTRTSLSPRAGARRPRPPPREQTLNA